LHRLLYVFIIYIYVRCQYDLVKQTKENLLPLCDLNYNMIKRNVLKEEAIEVLRNYALHLWVIEMPDIFLNVVRLLIRFAKPYTNFISEMLVSFYLINVYCWLLFHVKGVIRWSQWLKPTFIKQHYCAFEFLMSDQWMHYIFSEISSNCIPSLLSFKRLVWLIITFYEQSVHFVWTTIFMSFYGFITRYISVFTF